MKNPIAYLKHIVKDPINTIAEADARKKEVMLLLYISLGVLAIGVILQLALELSFMVALSFLGLVGAAFSGFLLSVVNSAKKKFECLTCNNCHAMAEIKTVEEFAKYVSFKVLKDEAVFNGYSGNKEPTNGVYSLVKFSGSANAEATVSLTCPHCGTVKYLKYSAHPFKCHAEAKGVDILHIKDVSEQLEAAVRTAVTDYNIPDKKESIPYTFHSSKNPNFEQRFSFKGANASNAHPDYMGAKIDYRKDVEEMLQHYFVLNELNGALVDPGKVQKAK